MDAEVVQLARGIIRDHFGAVAEEVVHSLLEDGPQTLSELEKRLAPHKDDAIRGSLTALIQHSIVAYTVDVQRHKRKTPATSKSGKEGGKGKGGEEEEEEEEDVFSTDTEGIIRRLQYPHYLSIANSILGEYAGIVVSVALESGISSADKIVNMVCEKCATRAGQDPQLYTERDIERDTTHARAAVKALVSGHFLVRVLQNSELTRPPAKKRGNMGDRVTVPGFALAGSTAIPPSKSPVLANHQRKVAAAATPSRSQSTANAEFFEDAISSSHSESPAQTDDSWIEPNSLWRVNFAQFVKHQQMHDVLEYISSKSGHIGAEVAKVVLKLAGNTDRPVDFNAIRSAAKASAVVNLTGDNDDTKLMLVLEEMVKEGVLVRQREDAFGVNMGSIIADIKTATIGDIIDEKFGPRALRLFNAVVRRRTVEERQLCEFALMQKSDAIPILESLRTAGFLSLKTVVCKGGFSLRLWSVDSAAVCAVGEREIIRTLIKLRRVAAEEIERGKTLISKAQREDDIRENNLSGGVNVAGEDEGGDENSLSPDERVALDKLLAKQERLDQTIVRIAGMNVVLKEYSN